MIEDWKSEIVKGVMIQQRIEELDREGMWERHLPGLAASEDEIAATEQRLRFRLDERYREFLGFANGWRCFYQAVDLFGAQNLLGAPPMDSAIAMLGAVEHDDFEALVGLSGGDVMPIAASAVQPDMFLLGLPWSSSPGSVVWFTGQVIDRFPDFDEFFLAMLDYNREEIRYLERGSSS